MLSPKMNKPKSLIFSMCEEEYLMKSEDYMGLCISCGTEKDSCEPDASGYTCENCEKPSVYGMEELMLMGRIRIVD